MPHYSDFCSCLWVLWLLRVAIGRYIWQGHNTPEVLRMHWLPQMCDWIAFFWFLSAIIVDWFALQFTLFWRSFRLLLWFLGVLFFRDIRELGSLHYTFNPNLWGFTLSWVFPYHCCNSTKTFLLRNLLVTVLDFWISYNWLLLLIIRSEVLDRTNILILTRIALSLMLVALVLVLLWVVWLELSV